MKRFKITKNSGEVFEYISEEALDWTALGLGLSERSEIGPDGEPTGLMLPAEYTVEIEDISYDHDLSQVLAKRKSLYPSPEEFLNAFFDGGESAIEELRQLRLAVKAANPKPTKP